ncbi:MAG: hypothetical protein JWO32_1187 [Bacteroidetes bacterium]|nr:hypothetical protein [Bacteroidota bacterium]
MKRINTLEDLKAEKKRLMYKRLNLEREIKNDFEDIKKSLEPVNLFTSGAKKTLTKEDNHILGNSAGQMANFLVKTSLKNSGFLPQLIVPFIVKTVTSKIVEKNKSKIINWIGTLANKVAGKKTAQE